MKLTNEEIAKVFAMYYPLRPINAIYNDRSYENTTATDLKALGMVIGNDVVLPLTLLSEITDEHAIKVAELAACLYYRIDETFKVIKEDGRIDVYSSKVMHTDGIDIGYRYKTTIYEDCFYHKSGEPTRPINYMAYQYLVSNGYAVPLWFGIDHWANGKTPIELEIALDKTLQPITS